MEVVSAPAPDPTVAQPAPHQATKESLRCPRCRLVDWYRDGFAIYEQPDGSVHRLRTGPSAGPFAPWSCARCGETVPWRAPLHQRLGELQATHVE